MGLDMYLEVEVYIDRPMEYYSEERKAEKTPEWEAALSLMPAEPFEHVFGATLKYNVAYWRKASAIHKWFVDNIQGGVDNCGHHYVKREQLNELLALCQKVLKSTILEDGTLHNGTQWINDVKTEIYEDGKVIANPEEISKLLPTTSGFFFGSTAYNEWYLDDVKSTISQLISVLAIYQDKMVDFYYHSSW